MILRDFTEKMIVKLLKVKDEKVILWYLGLPSILFTLLSSVNPSKQSSSRPIYIIFKLLRIWLPLNIYLGANADPLF